MQLFYLSLRGVENIYMVLRTNQDILFLNVLGTIASLLNFSPQTILTGKELLILLFRVNPKINNYQYIYEPLLNFQHFKFIL